MEEVGVVQEQHETYKGRAIVVRQRTPEAAAEGAAAERAEPELYIDDEPVFTLRDNAGMFIASGLAYDPQPSLIDLGKRIVDYRDVVQ